MKFLSDKYSFGLRMKLSYQEAKCAEEILGKESVVIGDFFKGYRIKGMIHFSKLDKTLQATPSDLLYFARLLRKNNKELYKPVAGDDKALDISAINADRYRDLWKTFGDSLSKITEENVELKSEDKETNSRQVQKLRDFVGSPFSQSVVDVQDDAKIQSILTPPCSYIRLTSSPEERENHFVVVLFDKDVFILDGDRYKFCMDVSGKTMTKVVDRSDRDGPKTYAAFEDFVSQNKVIFERWPLLNPNANKPEAPKGEALESGPKAALRV